MLLASCKDDPLEPMNLDAALLEIPILWWSVCVLLL